MKKPKFISGILLFIMMLLPIKQVWAIDNTSYEHVKMGEDTYILEDTSQFDNLKHPKIAVALGGGGGRALVHIGVLKALEEERIPIDMLVGTSMGGIISTMYGSGMTITEIERVATEAAFSNLFETNFFGTQSLLKTEKVNKFLERLTPVDQLKKFPIPTAFLSCELNTGNKYIHTSGRVSDKIQDAYAIPYYFPIQKQDEFTFIDPGIIESTPAKTARVLGADIVISSTAIGKLPYKDYNTANRSMMRMIELLQEKISRPITKEYSDAIIDNPVADYSFMDFNQAAELISIGYQHTKERMPKIKSLLRKHDIQFRKTDRKGTINLDHLLTDLKYDRLVLDSSLLTPKLYFGKDHSFFKQNLFKDDLFKPQYGAKWQKGQLEATVLNNHHEDNNLEAKLRVKQLTETTDLISNLNLDSNDNWELKLRHYTPNYTLSIGRKSINNSQFNLIDNKYTTKINNIKLEGETSVLVSPELDSWKVLTSHQGIFEISSIWSAKPKLVYNNTGLLKSPIIYRGSKPKDNVKLQTAIDWIYTHNFLPTIKLMEILQLTDIEYYLFSDYQTSYDSSQAVGIGADANLKLLGLKPLDFGIYIAEDDEDGSHFGWNIDLVF